MRAHVQTEAFAAAAELDAYAHAVSAIQREQTNISVPELSKLLGVKPTTLNARFRRDQLTLAVIGRTSFIPVELAIRLAALHKHALLGWPTLQQASQLTGIKAVTLKAKCEKGRLEGYKDLTKRLRINPAELEQLQLRPVMGTRAQAQKPVTREDPGSQQVQRREPKVKAGGTPRRREAQALIFAPALEPQIRVITAEDYGLAETEARGQPRLDKPRIVRNTQSGWVNYDPDRPLPVSECSVGRPIRYGHYAGTIVSVIEDPFSPMILARFPEHPHPLMREVLLIVEKSRK